jgi:hypothetical protein
MQRHFPITGFQADDLKKWERETPPPFSRSGPEKDGKAGESVIPAGKNSSPSTPPSPPSPPFFRSL